MGKIVECAEFIGRSTDDLKINTGELFEYRTNYAGEDIHGLEDDANTDRYSKSLTAARNEFNELIEGIKNLKDETNEEYKIQEKERLFNIVFYVDDLLRKTLHCGVDRDLLGNYSATDRVVNEWFGKCESIASNIRIFLESLIQNI